MNFRRKTFRLSSILLLLITVLASSIFAPVHFLPQINTARAITCPTGGVSNGCLTVSLDANSRPTKTQTAACAVPAGQDGVCDTSITTSASNATTFRVGAIINATSANSAKGVYGWQFGINYDPTIITPQGDPSPLCTAYPDCGEKTIWYGSQTSIGTTNWADAIASNTATSALSICENGAAGSSCPGPHSGRILVAFAFLLPSPPVTLSARTVLANVAFEIVGKGIATLTVSDVIFADQNANPITGISSAPPTPCTLGTLPNNTCGSITDTITNDPPHASFSTIKKSNTVYSFSSTSTDTDGTITSYYWDFGDGTQDFNVSGAVILSHDYGPNGTNVARGLFTVTLRIVDDKGATGSARNTRGNAIVNNQPSHFSATVLAATPDFNITITPSAMQLSTGSTGFLIVNITSVNGFSGTITLSSTAVSPITLTFNQTTILVPVGGMVSTFSIVNVPNSTPPGNYTLNITGDSGPIAHSASTVLTVTASNKPPIALFTYSPLNPTPQQQVFFDGSSSYDQDGTVTSWSWNFGDGYFATGSAFYRSFANAGSYTVTLTVTDNSGQTSSVLRIVQVVSGSVDIPPVAIFYYYTPSPSTADNVNFYGGSSYDPDGTITNYVWNFGDGSFLLYGSNVYHTFSNPGNYTVTLTVTDNAGLTDSTSKTITVHAALAHDVGIQSLYFNPQVAAQTQIVNVQVNLQNFGLQDENVTVTAYYDHHVIETRLMTLYRQNFCPSCTQYVFFNWDTSGVTPGNYTISATVFLADDQNLSNNNYTSPYMIKILPPPVLSVTPDNGPTGTTVTVTGSGFPVPYYFQSYYNQILVTFDDMFEGVAYVNTIGQINFTFSVPHAQPGIVHMIKAFDFTGARASIGFLFLPDPVRPPNLDLAIQTGTVYNPGETQVAYIRATIDGVPQTSQNVSLSVLLLKPDGTSSSVTATMISPGLFRLQYVVPMTSTSLGTYGLIVKAVSVSGQSAFEIQSFEVKPSWVQAHGQNLVSLTALVTGLGVAGVLLSSGRFRDQLRPRKLRDKEAPSQ